VWVPACGPASRGAVRAASAACSSVASRCSPRGPRHPRTRLNARHRRDSPANRDDPHARRSRRLLGRVRTTYSSTTPAPRPPAGTRARAIRVRAAAGRTCCPWLDAVSEPRIVCSVSMPSARLAPVARRTGSMVADEQIRAPEPADQCRCRTLQLTDTAIAGVLYRPGLDSNSSSAYDVHSYRRGVSRGGALRCGRSASAAKLSLGSKCETRVSRLAVGRGVTTRAAGSGWRGSQVSNLRRCTSRRVLCGLHCTCV
jgi:hypothetical protein